MARQETDLPFGDAFSPAQLSVGDGKEELTVVLELIEEYEGDPDAFDKAVAARFFMDSPNPENRAKNVRLGVSQVGYQLVGNDFQFTDLGEELYELREEPEAMYERFAQHILRNLHGHKIINIIRDIEAKGDSTTNGNIKQELRDQYDFHIDRTSNHWSQMRAWLSKADLINTRSPVYKIDDVAVENIVGIGETDLLELENLDKEPETFLRALALINPSKPIRNSVVRKVAESAYGVQIEQSNISKNTLDPLEELGYITWEHRSGSPNRVETTDKFDAEVLKPVLDDLAERVGVPRSVLRQPFDDVLEQMDSGSTYERGMALETLSIKLGRMMGLEFVAWRLRGQSTDGAEVDVIMDRVGTMYSRCQIRCKNTKKELDRAYVEREVGVTQTLQTNTLIMVARGGVSSEAREFANRVMNYGSISILFITGDVLANLDDRPDQLFAQLRQETNRIKRIKQNNLIDHDASEDIEEVAEREAEALEEYQEDLEEYQPDYTERTLDEYADDD